MFTYLVHRGLHEKAMEHGRSSVKPMRFPTCLCGAVGERDPQHDAYFCPASGVWLEDGCKDTECRYCIGRPAIHGESERAG